MDCCRLPVAISIASCAIAEQLADDELALVSAVFSQIGDTLATIATQRSICAQQKELCETPSVKAAADSGATAVDPVTKSD